MTDRSPDVPNEAAHQLRGAELSALYPNVKTYDDQLADQADRARRQLARQPRHVALNVALRLFVLAAATALIAASAPVIIFVNVFAGVFAMALLVIVLLGACKWQADEISILLDKVGLHAGGFLTLYFVIIGPLGALGLFAVNTQLAGLPRVAAYGAIFGLFLAFVGGILGRMRNSR